MTNTPTDTVPPETGHHHSIEEVARIMGVSVRTVRRWIKRPDGLATFQRGRLIRISHNDLLAFQFKHRT